MLQLPKILILCALALSVRAQLSPKVLTATKVPPRPVVIDGHLNDSLWQRGGLPAAGSFVMFEPGDGNPVPDKFRTRVMLAYSEEALYLGAMMYDHAPDSILTQFTERDDYNQNNDWFQLAVNPYNDGLSDFNFFVTAAGVQADSRTTALLEDFGWNSVWESAIQITDSGWSVEMRIPYMALRIPEAPNSDWGLNFFRNIRRNRTTWSWNYIDRTSGYRKEFQCGRLQGIGAIEPPVRLSLMPYMSAYADRFDGANTYDLNAGLDLKYGLNESFTLDMTLIPDFGQVALDQQFINFSPFENRFDENRQFFTEGTELFSLGDIFYSRRIGGVPRNISNTGLQDSGVVDVQTEYTRMLNATKISGRTSGNLGIGVLNAITDNSYTTLTDAEGNTQRSLNEPLTNYNMLVLDQRLYRNSSVSFVNTNVLRNGADYDANVAGLLASLNLWEGHYQMDGSVKRSDQFYSDSTRSGYEGQFRFGDVDGNWVWSLSQDLKTDQYDPNDLGFLPRNNLWNQRAEVGYRILKPHGKLNRSTYTLGATRQTLYQPRRFEYAFFDFTAFLLDREFNGFRASATYSPFASFDYFEPRTPGYRFRIDQQYSFWGFVSTDYRKTLAIDAEFFYEHWVDFGRDQYQISFNPRLRLGDHFFGIIGLDLNHTSNDYGFARSENNQVLFGRRNLYSVSPSFNLRYVFTPTQTLSLVTRHLWTGLRYREMYELSRTGQLYRSAAKLQEDLNFNTLNLDLRFSWWFAPGSELVLLYRHVVAASAGSFQQNYSRNIDRTFNAPAQDNLSLRITYFLDYNQVRAHF